MFSSFIGLFRLTSALNMAYVLVATNIRGISRDDSVQKMRGRMGRGKGLFRLRSCDQGAAEPPLHIKIYALEIIVSF